MDKPYRSLNEYYREIFGRKTAKISLDGGFTCPNRDGTCGERGCLFCSAGGSGDFAENAALSITEQVEKGKAQTSDKWKDPAYVAYFQAFTNTYAPVEELRRKYDEALSSLSKVKKRGFSSAIITAYKDGKSMNLKSARTLEKELANSGVYQVCIEGYDSLPQEILSVIRGITEKDIAKTANGGNVRYVIGPFGNEEEAKILVTGLRAVSDKVIEVEKVK